MNYRNPHTLRERGFSLVEIMVALAISLLLIGGVLQIFLSSKQAYRAQDNLSRVQENGRFATDYLGRHVRLAGYRADLSKTPAITFPAGSEAIVGTNDDADGGNDIKDGTDVITVRFESDGTMRDCLGSLIAPNRLGTNVLRISSVTNDQVCTTPAGQQICQNPPLCTVIAAQGADRTETIVEDVENMQILFGEDTDGNRVADRYLPAGAAGLDMNRVVSIRISLLLQTMENNLADAPQPYNYNGATTTPPTGDLRLRRVYTNTVTLRNRAL
jgi:type IV pilus assembly protein PilW